MGAKEAIDAAMNGISDFFGKIYLDINGVIPQKYQILTQLLFYSIFLTLYAWFIWRFQKFVSSRDIIKLDLSSHKWSNNPFLNKLSAIATFILSHIIILPAIVLLWFSVMSLFFFVFVQNLEVTSIVFIASSLIISIRIIAHFSEELSEHLIKIVSFALMAIFLVNSGTFAVSAILDKIGEIPLLLETLVMYMVLIVIVELILKIIVSFKTLISDSDGSQEDEEDTTTVKEIVERKKEDKPVVIVKKEEVFDYKPSDKVSKQNKYFVAPKKVKLK